MEVQPSQRLRYELVNNNDAQHLFELDSDPEVMRYVAKGKTTPMEDIIEKALPRLNKYTNAALGWGMWKAIDKETDEFLGWVLVRPFDFFTDEVQWNNLEIGWRFKQKFWGKGFASEAALAVQNALKRFYAVPQKSAPAQVTKLSAIADKDNLGSIGVMKKLGLTYVKSYMFQLPNGEQEPVVYYETAL